MKLRIILFALLISLSAAVCGHSAALIELSVVERDTVDSRSILVFSDTVVVHPDNAYNIFTGPLTISMVTLRPVGENFHCHVEAATTEAVPDRISKKIWLETGKIAELGLNGKQDKVFETTVTVIRFIDAPRYGATEEWSSGESVHYNLSFDESKIFGANIPYYGAYLERVDETLKNDFNFYYPGKINVFFYGDKKNDVYWDKMYPVSFDPPHMRLSFIYDPHDIPPIATLATAFLLYSKWGYSHPFCVWGAAGYTEEPHFFAAKEYNSGNTIDPSDYFTPRREWKGDSNEYLPFIGSFVRFLIDRYGISKFKQFYRKCSDLTNIRLELARHYGDSYEYLMRDWLSMLGNYNPGRPELGYYAESQFNYLNDYNRSLLLYGFIYAKNPADYTAGLKFGMSLYNLGDYSGAADVYSRLIETMGGTAEYYYLLGNAYYSAGNYENAELNYKEAIKIDDKFSQAYFKLGNLYNHFGRYKEARKTLENALGWAPEGGIYSEIYLEWGRAYKNLGKESVADSLAELGEYFAKTKFAAQPRSRITKMLLGEAYIEADKPDSAFIHISDIINNENRSYYMGRLDLAMGKIYDLKGEREVAIEYYDNVLYSRSAAYHKLEARKYKNNPFRIK
ncbi:MAG: tetratricopeptide repeat protein [candidate division Zixibacteria bacterium]|nr:tetratricopeptide repeat protein [candidate division Zixibacteria bacterium]